MNIAIIDIGTNTFHLIIAKIAGNEPEIIYKTNEAVKLGEDLTRHNLIIPAAFERAITCLQKFKIIIDQYNIDQIKATATSGVRSADNGQAFVDAVKTLTAIEIEIIDGDEEAAYIYQGVKWSGAITDTSLIMDIGGGSTEFILCDTEKLIWKKSYNIGAARLMQLFFKSDPISKNDQEKLETHIAQTLKELLNICKPYNIKALIGSAGAFETFAGMINPRLDLIKNKRSTINLQDYQQLAKKLIRANHDERSNMPGLIPLRVDMIVMACILTDYILSELHIKQLKLSSYDLKMGVLQRFV